MSIQTDNFGDDFVPAPRVVSAAPTSPNEEAIERALRPKLLQEYVGQTKVPGIGKKTAERLLLELKGKLGADLGPSTAGAPSHQNDILQALLALGYNDKEAASALKALPADVGVSEGIKLALKSLAK